METSLKVTISLNDAMSAALGRIRTNLNKVGKDFEVTEKQAIKSTDKMFDSFNEFAGGIAKRMVVATGVMTTAIVGFGTKAAAEMERTRTFLNVLTGSVEVGAETYRKLVQVAKTTPFETRHLVNATQTMLGYNVSLEDSQKALLMLGDIALGNSERLKHLTLAFSQVSSAGKLTGQDLLQLVSAGFNPLQEISRTTGESMDNLRKRMSDGKISFEEVMNAMKTATSEGGRFYQGMEEGNKTLAGRFAQLREEVSLSITELLGLNESGEIVEGTFLDIAKNGINTLIEHLKKVDFTETAKKLGDALQSVIDAIDKTTKFYNENKDAVDALAIAMGTFTVSLYTMVAATKGIAAIKGAFIAMKVAGVVSFGIIAAVIAVVAGLAFLIYKNWDWIAGKAKEIWGNITKTVNETWDKINKKWTETKDSIVKTAEDLRDRVVGFITKVRNDVNDRFTQIRNKATEVWNAITKFIGDRINDIKWILSNPFEALGFALGNIMGFNIIVFTAITNFVNDRINDIKRFFESIPGFVAGVWENIKKFWNDGSTWVSNKTSEIVNGIVNFFLGIPGAISGLWETIKRMANEGFTNVHNAVTNGINWIVDRFRELPGRARDAWTGLRDSFNVNISRVHDATTNGINWIVDRFKELPGKIRDKLSEWFTTGQNVMKQFWNGILNNMGSFAKGFREGLQRQGIRLASGTNFAMGGQYLVGETGPELVTLPRGAQVTRASETKGAMQGQTVNITINNPTVRNDNDLQMIIDQVSEAFAKTQRLKRLGV